jgi:hypothetical protein
MDKLTEADTINCAAQLTDAIEAIRERHGWSSADVVAVALAAVTEIAGRNLGPAQTARLFAEHAEALAAEHKRRAVI